MRDIYVLCLSCLNHIVKIPQTEQSAVCSCGQIVLNPYRKKSCATCFYGDEGVCQFAGEITEDFCCEKYEEKKDV